MLIEKPDTVQIKCSKICRIYIFLYLYLQEIKPWYFYLWCCNVRLLFEYIPKRFVIVYHRGYNQQISLRNIRYQIKQMIYFFQCIFYGLKKTSNSLCCKFCFFFCKSRTTSGRQREFYFNNFKMSDELHLLVWLCPGNFTYTRTHTYWQWTQPYSPTS